MDQLGVNTYLYYVRSRMGPLARQNRLENKEFSRDSSHDKIIFFLYLLYESASPIHYML